MIRDRIKEVFSLLFAISLALCVQIPAMAAENGTPSKGAASQGVKTWASDGIDFVIKNGFVGMEQESFDLDFPVTRGDFLIVLYQLAGKPDTVREWPFSDVSENTRYADALGWAVCHTAVSGYPDGTFRADSSLSREQAMVILYQLLRSSRYPSLPIFVEGDSELTRFRDCGQVSKWAEDAVKWAVSSNLICGTKNGGSLAIEPKRAITQKELAALLMRFDKIFHWPGKSTAAGTEQNTVRVYGVFGDGALYALTDQDAATLQALLEDDKWEDSGFAEQIPTYVITLGETEYLVCMENGELYPFYSYTRSGKYGGKSMRDTSMIEKIASICQKYTPNL